MDLAEELKDPSFREAFELQLSKMIESPKIDSQDKDGHYV